MVEDASDSYVSMLPGEDPACAFCLWKKKKKFEMINYRFLNSIGFIERMVVKW